MSRSPFVSLARFFSTALIFALLCGIVSAQNPKAKAKAKSDEKAAPKTKLETKAKGPVYASPEEAEKDPQFAFQGEYKGEIKMKDADYDGDRETVGVQVIARGKGKYHVVLYHGGLPGDGWKTGDKKEEADCEIQNDAGKIKFASITLSFKGEPLGGSGRRNVTTTVVDSSGKQIGTLSNVMRKSPTLGAKPPKGAVVLFDGSSTAAFEKSEMTDDKLLMPEAITKQKFQSFTLHAEFRTPFQPEDGNTPKTAQHRGNSGIYFQNRYEIQILDSFGLEPANDYCGGFYKFHVPKLNMCFPPLSWQTYDVDFTAPQYEGNKKVKNARLTAKLNGVVIHDNIELVQETAGSLLKEGPEPGGLLFQQHGNPVRFKNIWIVEK